MFIPSQTGSGRVDVGTGAAQGYGLPTTFDKGFGKGLYKVRVVGQ
ncbi:hypothetical protein ACFW2V_09130 [Streptomyces sp. NPDC058947]